MTNLLNQHKTLDSYQQGDTMEEKIKKILTDKNFKQARDFVLTLDIDQDFSNETWELLSDLTHFILSNQDKQEAITRTKAKSLKPIK
jgi:hypothetical protein